MNYTRFAPNLPLTRSFLLQNTRNNMIPWFPLRVFRKLRISKSMCNLDCISHFLHLILMVRIGSWYFGIISSSCFSNPSTLECILLDGIWLVRLIVGLKKLTHWILNKNRNNLSFRSDLSIDQCYQTWTGHWLNRSTGSLSHGSTTQWVTNWLIFFIGKKDV